MVAVAARRLTNTYRRTTWPFLQAGTKRRWFGTKKKKLVLDEKTSGRTIKVIGRRTHAATVLTTELLLFDHHCSCWPNGKRSDEKTANARTGLLPVQLRSTHETTLYREIFVNGGTRTQPASRRQRNLRAPARWGNRLLAGGGGVAFTVATTSWSQKRRVRLYLFFFFLSFLFFSLLFPPGRNIYPPFFEVPKDHAPAVYLYRRVAKH